MEKEKQLEIATALGEKNYEIFRARLNKEKVFRNQLEMFLVPYMTVSDRDDWEIRLSEEHWHSLPAFFSHDGVSERTHSVEYGISYEGSGSGASRLITLDKDVDDEDVDFQGLIEQEVWDRSTFEDDGGWDDGTSVLHVDIEDSSMVYDIPSYDVLMKRLGGTSTPVAA